MTVSYRFPRWLRPARHSFWFTQALEAENAAEPRMLEGALRVDVCVVGGGYSGLWTAIRLVERSPGLVVAVVDADLCGSGASGRNGGIVIGSWPKFPTLRKAVGGEAALRVVRATVEAIEAIARVGDAAHFTRAPWLWTATSDAQVGAWSRAWDELEAAGAQPFRQVSREELTERLGTDAAIAGIEDPGAATVQPALLARALRRAALERGVAVFERSPATEVSAGARVEVRTQRGRVHADKLVLAVNAWATALPELRRAVVPVASDMITTTQISERLATAAPWDVSMSDSRALINYVRPTRDGRVAFGRGGGALAFRGRLGPGFDHSAARTSDVADAFRRMFPALADVPLEHAWAGAVDRSQTGLPWVGALGRDERLLYVVGYSGTGVAQTAALGDVIAAQVLAAADDAQEIATALARCAQAPLLPREPFRYLGGRLVRRAVEVKEIAEDEGREPAWLARRLAALAPAGVVDRANAPAAVTTRGRV